jgi:site-specific recombinase XerD
VREEDWGINEKVARRIEMPTVEETIIETFTREQLKKLLIACGREYNRELTERDRAILHVLLSTGVKASELCCLTVQHTHLTPYDAHIRVMGKGRREREVGLNDQARAHPHWYLSRFREGRKGEPHVFLNRNHEPLTPDGLDEMLYRLRDWTGISGVRVQRAHLQTHLRRGVSAPEWRRVHALAAAGAFVGQGHGTRNCSGGVAGVGRLEP